MNGISFRAPIVQVYHEKSMILPDVSRVLACLYEKDVEFETHTTSNKSLLRLQASSHAPVPFYDGPTFLEESREICRYIAEKYEHHGNPFLLGKDALERASVEQWLHHKEHAFNPPSRALFCHLAFPLVEEDDGDHIDMHRRKLEEVLDVYEQRLGDSEFLVGDKFTLADLVHLPNSHYIKTSNEFLCLYDSRKNVRRWWDAISDQDSWKKVLSYMESVKNQNKQEELDRQQQQQQKVDPKASSHPSHVYSRKQVSTEPQTILVSPADSYKSDSRATGVDSQFKEAVTYSARTPPELETTGTSASKLQTTGLNDIKQDADHLISTGQGKLSNDVQQYQLQDSEQATANPVPQEPMGMELVQGREPYTFFLNCRPYTGQSGDVLSPLPQQTTDAREIVEDNASSGKRGAVPSSSTQEHGVTPPRQAADKDGQSTIPSQAEYPGGQDTRKQHRDHGSVSSQRAVQDARATFGESKASNFTISNERFSYTSDDRHTDDSGKPFVPSQERVSHTSQVIPGKEETTYAPSTRVFPTTDTQLASAEDHEVTPDDQHGFGSITPSVSSGKQGSHVGSAFESGGVGPAEKKFAPSDQELAHSAEQHGEPRKEQTVVPTAEQIKAQPTTIDRQETADNRKEALTSDDVLDTTPTHGDHPTGSIEPARRPLSVEGEEPTSPTQAPSPHVVRDSSHTEDISAELENVRSMKPSITPDARDITGGSTPGEVAFTEQESAPPGQGSADPAQPTSSLGPRNEDIRDIASSAPLLSSTDPREGDSIVTEPDQAKDSQTTPRRQGILPTRHPSVKVQEDIPGDDSGEAKPSRPSSAVQEGKSSKVAPASAPVIQLGSVPNEVALDEQKFSPSGQDSSYPAQPPSSAEPRSKEIGDLSPSTQLNYTTEPRNGDAIVAAPDQAKDSQETPQRQFKLSAPSSYTQLPSGKPQGDKPSDNLSEAKSSKPPSAEDRLAAAVPVSAPHTQHGAAPDEVTVDEQKFAPSGQRSSHITFVAPAPDTQSGIELDKEDVDKQKVAPSGQHSVHPSFSNEPTKENTVAAATDQTSTLDKIIDQNYMTPAQDKVKTPFSGIPYATRQTQNGSNDDHIDEKLPSQRRVPPDSHVSESSKGLSPEAHSDVDKKTTPGSSQAETSNTVPDSTPIYGDARLSSGDVPTESSLPETQDLQGSSSAQNVPADPLGNIESPRYLSTDQVMAPKMSSTIPSAAPLGTIPGTNSVQAPQQASTVDVESAPDTQHGMPQGRANPPEQKFAISDQEPAHISEPRKEEGNAAAGDQPNVRQGPETTDQHQVKAPSPDAREPLQKDRQPSHAVLPSDLHDGPTSEVHSAVVDKETPLILNQDQTSAAERNPTLTSGDVPPTSSLKKREAEPPAATQAPTSQVLQSSALAQNDSLGNIVSPRQASADQVMVPAINSAAPSDAPQVTEPGPNSSQPLKPPFSTETTKQDTVVTADDQANDMKPITHQQAITPAPAIAKTPFPSSQNASSTDDGRIDELLPSQEQVSLLGSNSELHEGQTADPYGTHVDEKTTKSPSSQANISDSESGLARSLDDVVPSIGEGLAKILSPERGEPTQLPAATQDVSLDASSKAKSTGQGDKVPTRYPASSLKSQPASSQTQGEAAPGEQNFAVSDKKYANASKSVPSAESRKEKTNAASVDQMSVPHTTVTHQVTSSTPDASEALSRDHESSRNDDDIRNLADPLIANQEEGTTVAAADQAKGMQTIAHQQAISPAPGASKTPVPSIQGASRTIQESTVDDGHVNEPLPSQEQVSLHGSYSEPREEQTTDPYGMNIDDKTTTFPSSQANISDLGSGLAPTLGVVLPSAGEGPAKFSFPEPGEQTQMPAATQDVSLEASSKAKSTGQGAKALTGDPASVLDTQPGSSQTQGEAAPAEQKFVVTDKKSANASKSPFSAEPREEQTNVATADQTSVPETTITNQAANAKPDASDTLEKDHESSHHDDHISNSANLVVSEEAASGRASEESSDAIDKKMTLPSSETQTSSTGLDSTPNSSDAYLGSAGVPATSSVWNQDLQPPATQALTTQALQGSPSFQIVPDSQEKLNSPRLPSTTAPVTSPATPSGAPQGTEPGTHSVQPSHEASFDFLSDAKTPTTQGDQVKTLPNDDVSTNQVVGQSDSADSQWNLKGASTNEKSRTQQQIDQFGTQSFRDKNKEADGTVRSNISKTFEEFQKQPSWPKGRMESSGKSGNQQQADQAIVEPLEGNENQAEQIKRHDSETIEPEDMEALENTNQKNNRRSPVETLGHSGKQASGVQQLGENTKDIPNLTGDAPGDVQAVTKSEDSSRSSEESKVLQSEDKNQSGETESPSSEFGNPSGQGLAANSYQNNSSQSQAAAPDKSVEQSSPGIQNKGSNSSRFDGSTDPTKPGLMKD